MVEKSDETEPRADAGGDPAAVATNPIEVEAELKRLGKEIDGLRKQLGRATAEAVLKMGRHLLAAKAVAGPKRRFHQWLHKCRIVPRTAERYMARAKEFDALPEKAKHDILSHLPKLGFAAMMKSIEPPEEMPRRAKPAAAAAAARPAIESPLAEATDPGDLDRMWSINDPAVFARSLWDAVNVTRARAVSTSFTALLRAEDEKWNAAKPAEQDGPPDDRDDGQVEVEEPRTILPAVILPAVEEPPMSAAIAAGLARHMWTKFGPTVCREVFDALGTLILADEEAPTRH